MMCTEMGTCYNCKNVESEDLRDHVIEQFT